jgi:hypothetical protein
VRALAVLLLALLALAGCGSTARTPTISPHDLRLQRRPIGVGPEFHPAARDRPVPDCRRELGPRIAAHVEVFARNQVVLIAGGIGTRAPRTLRDGRIVAARCYGPIVTLEPTGVVLVRPDRARTLGDLFREWGQPLTTTRVASFPGRVRVYVGGRRKPIPPPAVDLTRHAEIVVEVGPFVPPHPTYGFPPGL